MGIVIGHEPTGAIGGMAQQAGQNQAGWKGWEADQQRQYQQRAFQHDGEMAKLGAELDKQAFEHQFDMEKDFALKKFQLEQKQDEKEHQYNLEYLDKRYDELAEYQRTKLQQQRNQQKYEYSQQIQHALDQYEPGTPEYELYQHELKALKKQKMRELEQSANAEAKQKAIQLDNKIKQIDESPYLSKQEKSQAKKGTLKEFYNIDPSEGFESTRFPKGKGVGQVWRDEDSGSYITRKPDGTIDQVTNYENSKEYKLIEERARLYEKLMNQTKIEGENQVQKYSHEEAMDIIDNVVGPVPGRDRGVSSTAPKYEMGRRGKQDEGQNMTPQQQQSQEPNQPQQQQQQDVVGQVRANPEGAAEYVAQKYKLSGEDKDKLHFIFSQGTDEQIQKALQYYIGRSNR